MKKNHRVAAAQRRPYPKAEIESIFTKVQALFLMNLKRVRPAVESCATFDPFSPASLRREFAFALAAAARQDEAPEMRVCRWQGAKFINSAGGAS